MSERKHEFGRHRGGKKVVTNRYKKRVMREYGEKHKTFHIDNLLSHMNNYRTASGKKHKSTGTTIQQLTSLLTTSPDYTRISDRTWRYNGSPDWLGEADER